MSAFVIDSMIFGDFYGTDEMRTIFGDRQLVQYWLDVEAALARTQAKLGIIPEDAAVEITAQATADAIDMVALRKSMQRVGYPIVALVWQLAARCGGTSGQYVHWGATTQDIMDTANALQVRAALDVLHRDLQALIVVLEGLARTHRDTPMAGRTHGQQALPITFGYKVAVWIDELRRHRERLEQMRPRVVRCSFAGAAGTLASLGPDGWAVHVGLAAELGLTAAPISWHTARDGFGEFVAWCGMVSATLGKMAREVANLQKSEVDELAEPFVPGKGSSSTMPQKRNPILCEAVIGLSGLVTQLVPAMLTAMRPEHERAMGEWHIEWATLPQATILTGAALAQSQQIFDGLVVNPSKMQSNLALTDGLIVAESVMMHLAPYVGRQRAHDLVYAACLRSADETTDLRTALLNDPEIAQFLGETSAERHQCVDMLLNPSHYLGLAPHYVDQILS